MATVRLTDATLSIGGVHLVDYTNATITTTVETESDESTWASGRLAELENTTLTFSGIWDGPSLLPDAIDRAITVTIRPRDIKAWRAWWRRCNPRIRRMHTAYRRKRGRGRW
jgi:hypothetical protein